MVGFLGFFAEIILKNKIICKYYPFRLKWKMKNENWKPLELRKSKQRLEICSRCISRLVGTSFLSSLLIFLAESVKSPNTRKVRSSSSRTIYYEKLEARLLTMNAMTVSIIICSEYAFKFTTLKLLQTE